MSPKRVLSIALQVAVVLAVLALIAGQLLGQPVLFSFVETGSMQPTLDPGDGFIAIPTALAGDVGIGDVVTFDAQEIEGGGLTTHRVVEETERGYVTRGDNNPFTDQDAGEPVVQDADIVAVALSVGGSVVVIPHLGTVAMTIQSGFASVQTWLAVTLGVRSLQGTQGLAYLIFGLSMVAYVADWFLSRNSRETRQRDRSRDDGISVFAVVAVLALVLMATATAAMVVPAGTQEYGVVSAEFESENPTVIERGHEPGTGVRRPQRRVGAGVRLRHPGESRRRGRPTATQGRQPRRGVDDGDAHRPARDRLLPIVRHRAPLPRGAPARRG